jgi:hypothetical protein
VTYDEIANLVDGRWLGRQLAPGAATPNAEHNAAHRSR